MRRDLVATGSLMGAGMLTVASSAIVVPSLLEFAEYFGGGVAGMNAANLFLVMPSVGLVAAAPVAGWLADRFGRWHILLGSVALLVLSGVSGYWTDQYPLLLIERFVLGCSTAGTVTSSASLLGALPEEARRQSLLGKQSAFTNVAGLTYLFLGGQLAAMHWRLPFLIYLWPVVLVPFLVVCLRTESPALVPKVEVSGKGFDVWLRGPAMPILLLAWGLGCLTMIFIYSLFTVHPYRMQELGLADPRIVSLTIMVAAASSAVASWNLRSIGRHLGPYPVFALTFLLFAAGFLIVAVASELWHVVLGNLVLEIGMGLPVPNGAAWLSGLTPGLWRSRVLGVFNTFVYMGQFLSLWLIRAANSFSPHIHHVHWGLGLACLVIACLMAVTVPYVHRLSSRLET
ncbi:MAG: MFS transporter [Caldilineaceae bacterium]|nr:MFS transporter [Caldilineaceae bacterium]